MKEGQILVRKIICFAIISVLLSTMFMAFSQHKTHVFAQTTEVKIINPLTSDGNFTFWTNATSIGDTFTANVSIFDVEGLTAWQVNVTWDPAMLELLDISRPADDVFAGQSVFTGSKDIDNTAGYVLWWIALGIGTTPVNATEGRLCQLSFNITASPTISEPLTCPIHIVVEGETTFYTKLEPSLTFVAVDGEYEFKYPPLPQPVLKVEPEEYTATQLGETFEVNVTMNNLLVDWQIIGVEFRLRYHPDMLELVDVEEGPFMKQFANPPNTEDNATLFIWYDESGSGADYVVVGIIIWPNMTGVPSWSMYAEGDGTLVTVTLKTIKLPASATLELFETKLIDDSVVDVPHSTQDGTFDFPWETLIHTIVVDSQSFDIITVSNGSITPVPMLLDAGNQWLRFNVTGEDGTVAFINITIPTGLIDAKDAPWTVLAGGLDISYTETQLNATHVMLSFSAGLSIEPILIKGDWVVPELQPSIFVMMLFVMALIGTAFAALALHKKSRPFAVVH